MTVILTWIGPEKRIPTAGNEVFIKTDGARKVNTHGDSIRDIKEKMITKLSISFKKIAFKFSFCV
jgi:hypothetical protein